MKKVLVATLLIWSACAQAVDANLTWNANVEPELDGYKIYRGPASGQYADVIDVGNVTQYTVAGLDSSVHYFAATAYGDVGGVYEESLFSNEVVFQGGGGGNPPDLVAAFGFDENTGTTVGDLSGQANNGTISGATWTTQGKFGNALTFDGVNDWITVNSAASLDLSTGSTIEAWVYPTAAMSGWDTVLVKERAGGTVYSLYANSGTVKPETGVYRVTNQYASTSGGAALPANTWTHVAGTYDGANVRLYVNGTQVALLAASGNILASTGVLRIGGNSIWTQFFNGRIDEVRVYNRALGPSEIASDMNTPVSGNPPGPMGTITIEAN